MYSFLDIETSSGVAGRCMGFDGSGLREVGFALSLELETFPCLECKCIKLKAFANT